MPKPSRCDCPDCNPPAWVIPPAPPLPSLPSLARPGPQTAAGGLSQDARELFARRIVHSNQRLGRYLETKRQRSPRVDYTTPGYQPPEAA